MSSITKFIYLAFMIMALVACGGSPDDGGSEGGVTANAESDSDSPAKPNCPHTLTSAPRQEGEPIDDILGLRPGVSYEDAKAFLECREGLTVTTSAKFLRLNTYGIPVRQRITAAAAVKCTSEEMRMARSSNSIGCAGGYKSVSEGIDVIFTGLEGQEKAGGVWRRKEYAEGEQPPIDSLLASLTEKYGAPHDSIIITRGIKTYAWAYDLLGRPMSKSDPNYGNCIHNPNPDINRSVNWNGACGLSIRADIHSNRQNEALATRLDVGVMHQKNFFDEGAAMQVALDAENARHKQAELEKAKQSAGKTEL
jgi:hypothetical protein